MQVGNYGYDLLIDTMTDESRYSYKFIAETKIYANFVAYFENYSDGLIQANNLDKLFCFAEKHFSSFKNELKDKYLQLLTKMLNSTYEESANYNKLLSHFEAIEIDAAIKAHTEILISHKAFDDVKKYCLSKLNEASPSDEAAKQLAHLLLLQEITLDESEK